MGPKCRHDASMSVILGCFRCLVASSSIPNRANKIAVRFFFPAGQGFQRLPPTPPSSRLPFTFSSPSPWLHPPGAVQNAHYSKILIVHQQNEHLGTVACAEPQKQQSFCNPVVLGIGRHSPTGRYVGFRCDGFQGYCLRRRP